MDDYSLESITESKNEWSARLVSTIAPLIVDGFKSIYNEADKLCVENDEEEKVLMTFQNLISRIPKWAPSIIADETKRIKEESRCEFLEELITCVHITHLKALTVVRVGQKQKRIELEIPSLEKFIHNTYICCARTIYKNVYLLDANVAPLTYQKHDRALEIIVKEGVLESIRNSVPIDVILRAYIEKTEEDEVLVRDAPNREETVSKTDDIVEDIGPVKSAATGTHAPTPLRSIVDSKTKHSETKHSSDVKFSDVVDTKLIPSVREESVPLMIGADMELDQEPLAINTVPSSDEPIHLDIEELNPKPNKNATGNQLNKPVAIDLSGMIEELK
jgi:hypothetical protein